jgi:hypothetical protein
MGGYREISPTNFSTHTSCDAPIHGVELPLYRSVIVMRNDGGAVGDLAGLAETL